MQVLDLYRQKLNKIYILSKKARDFRRKERLRKLYCQTYDAYQRQKLLLEESDQFQRIPPPVESAPRRLKEASYA